LPRSQISTRSRQRSYAGLRHAEVNATSRTRTSESRKPVGIPVADGAGVRSALVRAVADDLRWWNSSALSRRSCACSRTATGV
jgi:hypothetical protein